MPIKLSTELRDGYMRFELTGKRVVGEFAPGMQEVWSRVAREFEASGVTRLLGISRLTGPTRVADIYQSAVAACEALQRSNCEKVAIVILGGEAAREGNLLAENVAASRGLAVRMFASEAAALDWLLQP